MKKISYLFFSIVFVALILITSNNILAQNISEENNIVSTSAVTIKEQFKDPIMAQFMADNLTGGNIDGEITQDLINNTKKLTIEGNMTDIIGIDIFSNLQVLTINASQIYSLPESIGNLSKLDTLTIKNSNLTSLPDSIGNLSNLWHLSIQDSKIEELPESIGKLSGLWYIGIVNTPLTKLPNSIVDLTYLDTLHLDNTNVTSLPESIGNLIYLWQLSVINSNLKNLPDSLMNLSSLNVAFFQNNSIVDIDNNVFDFLSGVVSMDLSNQKYEEVLDTVGYLNNDYFFNTLPAYEQFPNYGLALTFKLIKPDSSMLEIVPEIIDGKVKIDDNLLDMEGEYRLISSGSSVSTKFSTEYSHTFNIEKSIPEIDLIGDDVIVINEGSDYIELGAIGNDKVDGDISDNIIVSGSVDINNHGSYIITYTVTNSSGFTTTITREVIVQSIPIIELIDNDKITIEEGIEFNDPGHFAIDNKDGDISGDVIVSGMVDVNTLGTYTLTYRVVNSFGNEAIVTREVSVIAKEEVIDSTSGDTTEENVEDKVDESNNKKAQVKKIPKTGGMINLVIGVTSIIGGSLILRKVNKK